MFNTILKYGVYPQKWKLSIVTPIHKSLDIDNPSNYRGVAVADCISKIYCKVINVRIGRYLQEKEFWSPNQNGFMPNAPFTPGGDCRATGHDSANHH